MSDGDEPVCTACGKDLNNCENWYLGDSGWVCPGCKVTRLVQGNSTLQRALRSMETTLIRSYQRCGAIVADPACSMRPAWRRELRSIARCLRILKELCVPESDNEKEELKENEHT